MLGGQGPCRWRKLVNRKAATRRNFLSSTELNPVFRCICGWSVVGVESFACVVEFE